MMLSEKELAHVLAMKEAGAKWMSKDEKVEQQVFFWDDKPHRNAGGFFVGRKPLAWFESELFPSMKPGNLISLEEAERA